MKEGYRAGGVYVGESARSLYERAKEHHDDEESRKEDSHRMKHWVLDHPDLSNPPKFKIKIVSSYRDPLTRQVSEAVRIELRGGNTLNSKTEYNRCRIPRLTIDHDVWNMMKRQQMKQREEEIMNMEEELKPTEMEDMENVIGPNKVISKRKDKPSIRTNAKKLKLTKLEEWGEKLVIEQNNSMSEWLTRSSREDQEEGLAKLWNHQNGIGHSCKMKQMELSFSQILHQTEVSNPEDEHAGRLDITQASMDAQDEATTGEKYKVNTGKMTGKEIKEMAAKNRSVKDWMKESPPIGWKSERVEHNNPGDSQYFDTEANLELDNLMAGNDNILSSISNRQKISWPKVAQPDKTSKGQKMSWSNVTQPNETSNNRQKISWPKVAQPHITSKGQKMSWSNVTQPPVTSNSRQKMSWSNVTQPQITSNNRQKMSWSNVTQPQLTSSNRQKISWPNVAQPQLTSNNRQKISWSNVTQPENEDRSSLQEEMVVQYIPPSSIHTAGGEQTGHYPGSHCMEPVLEVLKEFELEAILELDKWLTNNEQDENVCEDSLEDRMQYEDMVTEESGYDCLQFEEKVCNELRDMNVLDMTVMELQAWMNDKYAGQPDDTKPCVGGEDRDRVRRGNLEQDHGEVGSVNHVESSQNIPPILGMDIDFACKNIPGWKSSQARLTSEGSVPGMKQMADSKPGGSVGKSVYASGTWLVDGWLGKSSQPSSSGVGHGKNKVVSVPEDRSSHHSSVRVGSGKILACTHMLGCAANMCENIYGPGKQIPDIARGSFNCMTGWGKKRKRTKPWGSCRKTLPSSWCRPRTSSPWRTRRRRTANSREIQESEKEQPTNPAAESNDQPGDSQPGGEGGERDRVHRGGHDRDHVRDGEPVNTSVFDRQVSVKPRDWHLVKKRGIVPDGRTQSKLKFKVDNESSTLRGGGALVLRMTTGVFRMLTEG